MTMASVTSKGSDEHRASTTKGLGDTPLLRWRMGRAEACPTSYTRELMKARARPTSSVEGITLSLESSKVLSLLVDAELGGLNLGGVVRFDVATCRAGLDSHGRHVCVCVCVCVYGRETERAEGSAGKGEEGEGKGWNGMEWVEMIVCG